MKYIELNEIDSTNAYLSERLSSGGMVHWIVRHSEILLVSLSCIDVAHHSEEATALEHEVGIDIHEWIVTNLCLYGVVCLNSELSETWHILRSIVLGKVGYGCSEMAFQHLGNLEVKIEVAPHVELWQWKGFLLLAILICDAVLPVKDSSLEVLRKLCRNDIHILAILT